MEIKMKAISLIETTYKMLSRSYLLLILITLITFSSSSGKDIVLVIRQDGKDFEEALKGITEELKFEFELKDKVIDKKTDPEEITSEFKSVNPKLVILMDNSAVALFKKYQATLSAQDNLIPSISIMGIFIADAIKDLKNASGISYEIPIVTSIVNLRSVLGTSMKKVGVIHREFLKKFLKQNQDFCKMEGIEIVDVTLPNKNDNYKALLKDGVKTIIEEKGVDVIWVPNDNALLKPEIIKWVWVPMVKKYRIPVIVGVEVLVKPQLDFGTFAVLPDHVSLGSQAAEMVYDIMDNDWKCADAKVDPPLAVYKIINLPQAKRNFKVSEEKLKSIDKKLK